MNLTIYKVKEKKIIKTNEIPFEDNGIYIIIDQHMKRAKIWVWSGPDANNTDRYFAGVSATSIKSREKLYGASIEVVESGNEPESFPKLENLTLEEIPPEEKEISLSPELTEIYKNVPTPPDDIQIVHEEPSQPIITEEPVVGVQEIKAESKEEEVPVSEDVIKKPISSVKKKAGQAVFINQLKALLKDVSRSLEQTQNKIDKFLMEL